MRLVVTVEGLSGRFAIAPKVTWHKLKMSRTCDKRDIILHDHVQFFFEFAYFVKK